ncbi:hypothetical protein PMIN07_002679 [Paraphaeosphaeria minitans]
MPDVRTMGGCTATLPQSSTSHSPMDIYGITSSHSAIKHIAQWHWLYAQTWDASPCEDSYPMEGLIVKLPFRQHRLRRTCYPVLRQLQDIESKYLTTNHSLYTVYMSGISGQMHVLSKPDSPWAPSSAEPCVGTRKLQLHRGFQLPPASHRANSRNLAAKLHITITTNGKRHPRDSHFDPRLCLNSRYRCHGD